MRRLLVYKVMKLMSRERLLCGLENVITFLALGQNNHFKMFGGRGIEKRMVCCLSPAPPTPEPANCRQDRLMSRGSRMHPGNDVEHHGPWGPFPRTVKLGAGGWSGLKLEAHCLLGGLPLLPSDITIEMGKGLAFLQE